MNNKTFVDTRDCDLDCWSLWHRGLAVNNLMEWLGTTVEVACLWRATTLVVGFDTERVCEIVASRVAVERHRSDE